eukprot:6185670-Pleurochrysis_carterae.AAC.2
MKRRSFPLSPGLLGLLGKAVSELPAAAAAPSSSRPKRCKAGSSSSASAAKASTYLRGGVGGGEPGGAGDSITVGMLVCEEDSMQHSESEAENVEGYDVITVKMAGGDAIRRAYVSISRTIILLRNHKAILYS